MARIESGAGHELAFESWGEMLVNIPLCGRTWITRGGQTLEMSSGQLLLVGPCCHVTKHWHGLGQVLSLHVALATLEAVLGLPGATHLPVYLPPVALVDHVRMHTPLSFLELLLRDGAEGQGRLAGGAVAEHMERLLLALLSQELELKLAQPAPATPVTATAAKPSYVKRAEDLMRANATAELTLEDLAAAAGVSPRSLQYGFRKSMGTSPMMQLQRMQLECAMSCAAPARPTARSA